jgi:hypothetical protein
VAIARTVLATKSAVKASELSRVEPARRRRRKTVAGSIIDIVNTSGKEELARAPRTRRCARRTRTRLPAADQTRLGAIEHKRCGEGREARDDAFEERIVAEECRAVRGPLAVEMNFSMKEEDARHLCAEVIGRKLAKWEKAVFVCRSRESSGRET